MSVRGIPSLTLLVAFYTFPLVTFDSDTPAFDLLEPMCDCGNPPGSR